MSYLTSLQLRPEDLETMARENPCFKSMLTGYAAERVLLRIIQSNPMVSRIVKVSDTDVNTRADFAICYAGVNFTMELKTESVRGDVILKTSDVSHYSGFSTSAMPANRFDILAVSTFNRGKGWGFEFFDVADIPRSTHAKVPEALRKDFLIGTFRKSSDIHFTVDPFSVMDRIIAKQTASAS